MAEQPLTETISQRLQDDDDNKKSTTMTTEQRLDAMQKQIDSMNYEITELTSALRNKSFMITKISTELEKLKQRMDKTEESDINIQQMEEKELKQEIDKMPMPDLTVKQTDEKTEEPANKKKTYRGYLLLWSGSTRYKNESYNKIQLLNLKKFQQSNGKQKPYVFYLENMENKFFIKKNIQFSTNFDRHWFAADNITNIDSFPVYITKNIKKLNYTPFNNELIKNLSWKFKTLSSKKPNEISSPDNKHKKNSNLLFDVGANHSLIFRCGGVYAFNRKRCRECDVTIFNHLHDNNTINGYTLNLPYLPRAASLASCKFNAYTGVLCCIAGDTDGDDVTGNILELNLNSKREEAPKWKKSKVSLFTKRKGANLCLIDRQNLMIMGGKSKSGEKLNSVELYVNTAKNIDVEINRYKTTKVLSPLCLPRSASGCLLFNASDKRVVVGGGWGGFNNDDTKKTIEWYDAVKNKWYLYPYKTNFEHQFCPILWNDPYTNENVIYIGGDCIGIDSKSMLGRIEWIDIRENKNNKKWNVFNDNKSLEQMFSLQKVDEKMWRSRALMIS